MKAHEADGRRISTHLYIIRRHKNKNGGCCLVFNNFFSIFSGIKIKTFVFEQ